MVLKSLPPNYCIGDEWVEFVSYYCMIYRLSSVFHCSFNKSIYIRQMASTVDTSKFRVEKDTMGTIEVESTRYWGAQTERSKRNFNIGGEKMPLQLIYAFAHLKSVAAEVNGDLGTVLLLRLC